MAKPVCKKQAREVWQRKKLDGKADTILQAIGAFLKVQPDPQFRPALFRWLRDERWNDDYSLPAPPESAFEAPF